MARAQAALEDAITSGGPALSNLLAPYFDNIDPIDPLLGIDATLRSGFGDVVSAVDALARAIDDIGSFDVGSPGLPKNGLAKVHKGEIILDPRSSDVARRYGLGTGTVAVAGFGDVGERMLKRLEAIDSTIRTGDQINASVTYDSALSTELAIDRAARKNNKRLVMSNA